MACRHRGKTQQIARIDDRLDATQLTLAKAPRGSTRRQSFGQGVSPAADPNEQLKPLISQVLDLRKELRALFHNDPPFVPPLPNYQKGQIGKLAVCGVIMQKLSERQSLVIKVGNDRLDDIVLLEDCEFVLWKHKGEILKSADGFPYVNFPDTLEVTGTFSYRNPAGAIVTVPALRQYKWPHRKAMTNPAVDAEQAALPEPASRRKSVLTGSEPARPNAEPAESVADQDAVARKKLGGILTNARKLAKAGLTDAARKSLNRILKEAPGTSIAKEAQQELDQLGP